MVMSLWPLYGSPCRIDTTCGEHVEQTSVELLINAQRYASAIYYSDDPVSVRLSVFTARRRGICYGPVSVCVCLPVSVTSQSSTKTAKHRITQTKTQIAQGL